MKTLQPNVINIGGDSGGDGGGGDAGGVNSGGVGGGDVVVGGGDVGGGGGCVGSGGGGDTGDVVTMILVLGANFSPHIPSHKAKNCSGNYFALLTNIISGTSFHF